MKGKFKLFKKIPTKKHVILAMIYMHQRNFKSLQIRQNVNFDIKKVNGKY